MIELFDAGRLIPRRDRSPLLAAAMMVLGLIALGSHAVMLQRELQGLRAQAAAQQRELNKLKAAAPQAAPTLLADLQAQAEQLEAVVAAGSGSGGRAPYALSAPQWLERLDALAGPDIALSRAEIDRGGAVRIEGQARTPAAVSGYVQAWERQAELAPVRARAIDVRQDPLTATLLRFQMRANLPGSGP